MKSRRCVTSRATLIAGVTSLALMSFPALAQTAVASKNAQDASPSGNASSAAQPSDNSGDILVTARRRDETLQSTPVTITAFGLQQFDRLAIKDTTDLNGLSPNVQVARTGAGTGAVQVFIRGIGQDALAFNVENPVGTYVDDVYLGRIQGALLDILDLERIEILRGPQGTLYGRNSTVGAIKYVTRGPDLTRPTFRGMLTVGNFNRLDASVSASVPLVEDVLAFKIDAGVRNQQGYLEIVDVNGTPTGDHANAIERKSLRGAIKYQPTAALTIDLSGDYSDDTGGSSTGTPVIGCTGGSTAPCANLFGSPYKVGDNGANNGYTSSWGVAGKIAYDAGPVTLKSISSYRGLHNLDVIDITGRPNGNVILPDYKDQKQFSQELQVATNSTGPLSIVAGLFYYNERIHHFANFVNVDRNRDYQVSDSYAAYADATYRITDRWDVEVGGRYSIDKKRIDRTILNGGTGNVVLYTGSGKLRDEKLTYKVGTNYKITPDILVYGSYATGYRPGGFIFTYPTQAQIDARAVQNTTRNETAENAEVGVKTEFFDHALRVNLAAFRTRYIGLQQQDTTPPYPVLSKNLQIRGVEAEVEAHPTDELTLFGNAGYLYSRIVSGPNAGTTQRYVPEIQFTAGGEYRVPLANGNAVFAGGNVFHTSSFRTDDAFLPSVTQGAYTLVNGQIGIDFHGGRYRMSVDGKNLLDKAYFLSTNPDSGRWFAPPRTVSATFSVRM